MILLVHELYSEIDQEITAPDESPFLYAVRPHIYRHMFPAGSLKLQVLNSDKKLISESQSINISAIDLQDGTAPNNFYHGYVRFLLSTPIKGGTNFFLRLKATGYTFSETAYVGWCNDWDYEKYEASYNPNFDDEAPMDYEFFGVKQMLRSEGE